MQLVDYSINVDLYVQIEKSYFTILLLASLKVSASTTSNCLLVCKLVVLSVMEYENILDDKKKFTILFGTKKLTLT